MQIPFPSKDVVYYTGQYFRMEFMRRWIITGIEFYCTALMYKSMSLAMARASEGFRIRNSKAVLKWVSAYYDRGVSCGCSELESIERFGTLVLNTALLYDNLFSKCVAARTVCKRGEIQFNLDLSTTYDILVDFYERFNSTDGHGCDLSNTVRGGKYIKVKTATPPASISAEAKKAFKKHQSKSLPDFEKTLQASDGCGKCEKIGDLLLTLEQPPSWILYHTDHLFDALCAIVRHKHHRCTHPLKLSKDIKIGSKVIS